MCVWFDFTRFDEEAEEAAEAEAEEEEEEEDEAEAEEAEAASDLLLVRVLHVFLSHGPGSSLQWTRCQWAEAYDLVANCESHVFRSHLNGFSPVCDRRCASSM